MWSNSKLLILFSFVIIISGFSLLWYGLNPNTLTEVSPSPTPLVEKIPAATNPAVVGIEGEKAHVTEVVDGDTIKIDGGLTVRLLGIDTPETKHPSKPVECFGKQASNETKNLLLEKIVILQKDVSNSDKYGRLLRYVFLPLEDGRTLFVNDYLIREGFATALNYPPDDKYNEQFLEAQTEAKANKRGLWQACS